MRSEVNAGSAPPAAESIPWVAAVGNSQPRTILTFSLQEFVKGCGGVTKKLVDELLDKMTGNDHSKAVFQIRQVPISTGRGGWPSVLTSIKDSV